MNSTYLNIYTKTATLAVFRIFFGLLMAISLVRFWAKGWIDSVYIKPKFFFAYYGFEFVKPLGQWTYLLFAITFLAAIGVCLGYKYRVSIILFFVGFTYIELIDKTSYLNHYYFVSLLSFVMIFLPMHRYYSIDAVRDIRLRANQVPKWTVDVIKLLLAIVYIYAGLAKINSDWLLNAEPLTIWLNNKSYFPILGYFFKYKATAYFFSWFGMLYDVCIVFFLLNSTTRRFAYVVVVGFHILTHILFPIGMFPYIMIVSGLVFFEGSFHEKILKNIDIVLTKLSFKKNECLAEKEVVSQYYSCNSGRIVAGFFGVFFLIQLLLPWRYLAYPGELFWTEEGYRFSWRVMLIEKVGLTTFTIRDPETKKEFEIRNNDFLTSFQIKQMSTQPDFILQYAHMLRDHYIKEGIKNPEVYVESYVTLNGRISQRFIDPTVNLAEEKESFKHKNWILPFHGTIKGL